MESSSENIWGMALLPRGQTLPAGDVHMIKSSPFPKIMTKSDPNSIQILHFSAAA
jgi:hypothetical protein